MANSKEESIDLRFEDEEAKEFERKHVYEIYDKIAGEFSDTRYRAWPNVKRFVEQLPEATILVDLGTGNGKNLNLNDKIVSIGCDTSVRLLEICRQNQFECLAANVLELPFRDESIDACIFIAVLHHLVTEQRRLEALRNIVRMLKKDGQCLVYVWAFEQELRGNKSTYIKQRSDRELGDVKCVSIDLDKLKLSGSSIENGLKDVSNDLKNAQESENELKDVSTSLKSDELRDETSNFKENDRLSQDLSDVNVPKEEETIKTEFAANSANEHTNQQQNAKLMPIHYNGTKFKYQDCFVPWKKKNQVENTDLRYYHLFRENELDNLIKKLDNVQIIESYYDNGNWAVLFKRI